MEFPKIIGYVLFLCFNVRERRVRKKWRHPFVFFFLFFVGENGVSRDVTLCLIHEFLIR